jgi:hypothetical protein
MKFSFKAIKIYHPKTSKMNSKSLYLIILSLIFNAGGCSKSTIGDPKCDFYFNLRFIDKVTGEDLGLNGPTFSDSLIILNYNSPVFLNKTINDTSVFWGLLASSINYCNEIHYKNSTIREQFIISYTYDKKSDTLLVTTGKIGSDLLMTYYLNDSVINVVNKNQFISSTIELPTIQILK